MNRAEPSRMALEHHSEAGETLAELGEWELIRRLGAFAPPGQFADDAALLDVSSPSADQSDGGGREAPTGVTDDRALVINTDVLVEGLHFSDATTSPADVGWRAAAANLSDLAAMGATEVVGITVGLVAPSHTAWSWVEGVYQGLHEALRTHGGLLLGGDCSGGTQRLLAITALGRLAEGGGPIRRGDGRPGDRLVSTGPHGLSRLGLALLQGELNPRGLPGTSARWKGARASGGGRAAETSTQQSTTSTEASLSQALMRQAIKAHRRPVPRFDAVRALIGCRPAGTPWRLGGCDSSDGLAAAVAAIATASGCAARLERAWLPLEPAMATLPEAEAWCLGGGEDFELVLALERSWSDALIQALPGSMVIGELIAGTAGRLSWTDGGLCLGNEPSAGGFQHFH